MPNGEQWPRPGALSGPQLTARQEDAGLAGLEEVAAHGAPAQAAQARMLLARYASQGAGPGLDADAARLVDAYLNDPYLTR
jgi:hypothetical protein